ncbi:protein of unknown function [Acidithiobacillus ferrivorans]|nr:protein of unknown function [Acidithiobacillus ferrivorans]
MDWVRKKLKRKRGKIVGGGISGKPAVLMLREQSFDRSKTVKRRFFVTLVRGGSGMLVTPSPNCWRMARCGCF